MEEMWSGAPELSGAESEELFVEVESGISLRILRWFPNDESAVSNGPVVVVPGWGSVFEGWRPLLTEWVRRRPIVYIETREKKSAVIVKKVNKTDFEMSKHGADVLAVLNDLGIDSRCRLVLFFSGCDPVNRVIPKRCSKWPLVSSSSTEPGL